MRIVQTFWSGGGNPLIKSFGWPHAEYNLMSWALSCCSLREHYDEVALYTDKQGYEVLIEKLNLPYTEVHVVYDDNLCLPQHWAYAKIKTYSLQTKPFLHVDGDVYISRRFSDRILNSSLVVQNKEICTNYYRNMVKNMFSNTGLRFPNRISEQIKTGFIMSYNMGIFGGSDLPFIQKYCEEAFEFLKTNHLNDANYEQSKSDYNIFFEQILFALVSFGMNKKISCILESEIEDNGYTGKLFCDVENLSKYPILHIIGGHKKNENVIDMIKNALAHINISIYQEILKLFSYKNTRFYFANQPKISLTTEILIARYEDIINCKRNKWKLIGNKYLLKWTKRTADSIFAFFKNNPEEFVLTIHPCCFIYEMASNWKEEALVIIRERLKKNKYFYLKGVVVHPCLEENSIKETALSSFGYKIISRLQKGDTCVNNIIKECTKGFTQDKHEIILDAKQFVMEEIAELIRSGNVFIKNC